MKILLLEGELHLAQSMRRFLLSQGHLIDHYDNGKDALVAIRESGYDFYILDASPPLSEMAHNCIKAISGLHPDTPKIVTNADHNIEYLVEAFIAGVDDYLKKPFHLMELKVRMERLARQPKKMVVNATIALGDHYVFDKETGILYYDGAPQPFSQRESALLRLFIKNIGRVVSEDSMRSFIWSGQDIEGCTIRSLVNRVSSKLKESMIENIRGHGYIMRKI